MSDGEQQYREYLSANGLYDNPERRQEWTVAWNAAVDWALDGAEKAIDQAFVIASSRIFAAGPAVKG